MNNPLVSVIIPIYKVEQYLERCLDSVVNQTYRNLEIILVDDGSPDNCGAICDAYKAKDERIIVIHQENQGLSAARNAGLDICTGEYIAFVDSDDWVDKDYILKLIENAGHNVIVGTGMYIVSRNAYHKTQYIGKMVFDNDEVIESYAKYLQGIYKYGHNSPISHSFCNKLFSSKLFKNVRFVENKNYEDMFSYLEVLKRADSIKIVNEALYYYRQREGSITKTGNKKNKLNMVQARIYQEKQLENCEECLELVRFHSLKSAVLLLICKAQYNLTNSETIMLEEIVKERAYLASKDVRVWVVVKLLSYPKLLSITYNTYIKFRSMIR